MTTALPIAIIGAGPVGLAAAAHLIERGETPLVFEAAETVGANMLNWQHVRMFSPWEFTVDAASVRLLEQHGWQMPAKDALPTGGDMVFKYIKPLAELPEMRPHIHTGAKVIGVSRQRMDKVKSATRDDAPFILQIQHPDGSDSRFRARAVIDASGTWQNPNPIGANGLPALGEKAFANCIYYGIPDVLGADKERYANRHTLVVGAGHSAINALLALVDLRQEAPQTRITWALRSNNMQKILGGGTDDALPARGALGLRLKDALDAGALTIQAPFYIERLTCDDDNELLVEADTPNGLTLLPVDSIISATGSRPDLDMLRELRVGIDPALESVQYLSELIDPNIHSCGTVPPHGEAELRHPESNFYIVGMKSYGRAPTFLLATGYEQVRSIAAQLTGDEVAAREVQLCLPETGVCGTDLSADSNACCAPTAKDTNTIPVSNVTVF